MMQRGTRHELLARLVREVEKAQTTHPLRVAIDGMPAVGKTSLADELSDALRARGRWVIRATIEDFLFPRAQRYSRGPSSPEGCYFDSHDHEAIRQKLLEPLGPNGNRRFWPAVYHRETDTAVRSASSTAPADAVLLFDGVFLLRPEIVKHWDLSIFMTASFDRALERARSRGTALAGLAADTAEIEHAWRNRYRPSQELYALEANPTEHANIIVDNEDVERPRWSVRGAPTGKCASPH